MVLLMLRTNVIKCLDREDAYLFKHGYSADRGGGRLDSVGG